MSFPWAHPFSVRVDYWWPQHPPSPTFHFFSPADIYWSLSEKFPSGYPFPKVELQRRTSTSANWLSFNVFFGGIILSSLGPFFTLNLFVLFVSVTHKPLLPCLNMCHVPAPIPHSSHCRPCRRFPGRLYGLLNQYSNLVCKNCRTRRPDVSLYDFIYRKVSSPTTADALDSAKDSGMSPIKSDSH